MKLSQLNHPAVRLCTALAVVLVVAGSAAACPGCKDALAANDNQGGQLVAGYFWSILFMMSMPFVILGTFSGSMYLSVRRARAAEAAQAAAAHSGAAQTDALHSDALLSNVVQAAGEPVTAETGQELVGA